MDGTAYRTSIVKEDEETIVRISGDLDLVSAPDLDRQLRQLLDSGAKDILLEMREVTYIDSTGIRTLMGVALAARDRGGSLTIRDCSRPVSRLIEILGLEAMFGVDPSEED